LSKGFQFKQFFIEHDKCAMKVGTDSIMLGSWVDVADSKRILDIGTGSGILALMLAQKSVDDCLITGIDVDANACLQANRNALASPWSSQLNIRKISLQDFQAETRFDLIVSNPPYFEVYGRSNERGKVACEQRTKARQVSELTHLQLMQQVASLLSTNGRFCCILPVEGSAVIVAYAAELGLHCRRRLKVKAKPDGKTIRHLLEFSRLSDLSEQNNLSIYDQEQQYSRDYKTLCREFYQKF
jgi:tRNA1Val (adenine37-N6)-methyltransferase